MECKTAPNYSFPKPATILEILQFELPLKSNDMLLQLLSASAPL